MAINNDILDAGILSDVLNNEVFLQGKYLAIGINEDGSLGTKKNAPKGFDTDTATGLWRTGMYADMDGFGRGGKALDDVLLQGRAIEGFNIGYKLDGKTFVQSNMTLTGYTEIDGTLRDTSSKSAGQATWTGTTTEKLAVSQKITLLEDAKYVRVDVTLTNKSGETMSDLRYMRSFDPDQSDKYATTNRIDRQGDGSALVSSKLPDSNASFFLFSEDNRAVVSSFGFVNSNPYAAEAYSDAPDRGYSKTADVTSNINFALGTLKAGASASVTLYMGVTDDLSDTIKRIEGGSDDRDDDDDDDDDRDDDDGDDTPVDRAPVVKSDSLTVDEGEKGSGNVLSNDRDPEGKKLTAKLKSGPDNGTVSLSSDGDFVYTPKSGFSGSDTFTYIASDGKNSATGTVRVTVKEDSSPPPATPDGDLMSRPGLVNGSSSANQTLTGASNVANTFFFDTDARSGSDVITNFGKNDVLVLDKKLYDGNGDGVVTPSGGALSIDGPDGGDTVAFQNGVSALRYLGTDNGLAVYADASVRPNGAKESSLSNDSLWGDSGDSGRDVFFFNTALGADLGADQITRFGKRDMLVTTSKLEDSNGDGLIAFSGGVLTLGGKGSVSLKDTGGDMIGALEYDGAVNRDGSTYFVYSLNGSSTDTGDLPSGSIVLDEVVSYADDFTQSAMDAIELTGERGVGDGDAFYDYGLVETHLSF